LTSRDPFAGFPETPYSLHPYQYAYSDPVRFTDPTGMITGVAPADEYDWNAADAAAAQTCLNQGMWWDVVRKRCSTSFDWWNEDRPCIPGLEIEVPKADGGTKCEQLVWPQTVLNPDLLGKSSNQQTVCILGPGGTWIRMAQSSSNDEEDGAPSGGRGGGLPPGGGPGGGGDEIDESLELALRMRSQEQSIKDLAPNSKDFADLGLNPFSKDFPQQLLNYMRKAKVIHFDLSYMREINTPTGVLRGPKEWNTPGSTNWELRTVWDDLSLRGKTRFYLYMKEITPAEVLLIP
jgi:hypothetical protein